MNPGAIIAFLMTGSGRVISPPPLVLATLPFIYLVQGTLPFVDQTATLDIPYTGTQTIPSVEVVYATLPFIYTVTATLEF